MVRTCRPPFPYFRNAWNLIYGCVELMFRTCGHGIIWGAASITDKSYNSWKGWVCWRWKDLTYCTLNSVGASSANAGRLLSFFGWRFQPVSNRIVCDTVCEWCKCRQSNWDRKSNQFDSIRICIPLPNLQNNWRNSFVLNITMGGSATNKGSISRAHAHDVRMGESVQYWIISIGFWK